MLILRIRRAEVALKDGRLDEAFELARTDGVAPHRRGQRLITRLAGALAARGRGHLDADRLTEAAADCEKARLLAGNLPEVAALRADVAARSAGNRGARHHRHEAVATARDHIENGRLSLGARALETVPSEDDQAELLRREADRRRERAAAAIERAQQAVASQEWPQVIDALIEAREAHPNGAGLGELVARVNGELERQVRSAIEKGRLELAERWLAIWKPLSGGTVAEQELAWMSDQLRRVASWLEAGDLQLAADALRRMTIMLPGVAWLKEAADHVGRSVEGMNQVRGGPLGTLMAMEPPPRDRQRSRASQQSRDPQQSRDREGADGGRHRDAREDESTLPAAPMPGRLTGCEPVPKGGGQVPAKFLLQIDGVGSYLVLRNRRVVIGAERGRGLADVTLLADSSLPEVAIEREDEDYFLIGDGQVRVNGQPVRRRLLADGDRINLNARCGLKFGLPSRASTTAMLTLSAARLARRDVRRVMLLDRSLILGPGPGAHIRAEGLSQPAVLYVRDGRVFCRTAEPITVDDRMMDRNAGLPMNARIRIGPVSMVMTNAS